MKKKLFTFSFLLLIVLVSSQVTYNGYARVTTVTGSTLLAVANVNETNHSFAPGESVIVMQMQDDVIGTNTTNATTFGNLSSIANAGRYEVATVSAVNRSAGTPTTIALTSALVNTYNTGPNSRVQIITFRLLNATVFTTTASITGIAWNGNIGGVIALQVGTDFTISHSITANGIGFRGGAVSGNYYGGGSTCTTIDFATSSTQCAFKGEGIYAVTSTTQANGIAKALNGGGGGGQDINGGGGGGGNYTAGGNGGGGWNGGTGCTSPSAGGLAGITLSASISASRVFMGGGGGGGQQNNSASTAGGNGGGIILLKANRILTGGCAFSPTITANANNATNCGNDGGGGGGAGGSIVLNVDIYSVSAGCPLTVRTNGGNGATVNTSTHAGGGAGGQGVIIYSIAQPTTNISTLSNNGVAGCNDSGCASSAGTAAGSNNTGVVSSGIGPLPIELLYFLAKDLNESIELKWGTATEKNVDYFLIKRSIDGINWTNVDKVKAIGTTKLTQVYKSVDYNPPLGLVYYKLTSIDFDLSEQNSPIQALSREGHHSQITLYPNPAQTLLNITSPDNVAGLSIEIIDAMGRILKVAVIERSDLKLVLDISDLVSGVYFIRPLNTSNSVVKKLIIE